MTLRIEPLNYRLSASPAVVLVGGVGRQCGGQLPFSRWWRPMTACRYELQPDPTRNSHSYYRWFHGRYLSAAVTG